MILLIASPVWANRTTMCRVTYANSGGHVSCDYFRKNAVTVKKGTTICLPKYSKVGYKTYWITYLNGRRYSYTSGQKVKINQNIRFDLHRYEICKVKFFSADGKTEYRHLRKNVLKGETLKLPSVSSDDGYQFKGWSRKEGGKGEIKEGSSVKIGNNMVYYAVFQKTYGVKLYKYSGTYWKTINNKSGMETFPILGTTDGMYLGWSREKGKHTLYSSDFKGGNKIPGNSGSYYPVKFLTSMDKAPSILRPKYDHVYLVGDSRTVGMQKALEGKKPSNVNFIAKRGEGLNWLKDSAYNTLIKSVSRCSKKETKAVVFNFGVNDLANSVNYIQYLNKIAPTLRKYNCKLYYMSVNPVNSAMCSYRSEKNVAKFNYNIRYKLCSGKDAYYKYIDCCSYLQHNGWISRDKVGGGYDGLHYSHNTYLRIYDYCIKNINK